MTDNIRSATAKARKPPRKLVVVNPNPDSDSNGDDDDDRRSNNVSQPLYYEYRGHSVASPSALSPPFEQPPLASSSHRPHPLTTTDLSETQGINSRSRSNPTLSSPSTASSPAAESTPPPSTPGQSVGPVDLTGDTSQNAEPHIRSFGSSTDVASTSSQSRNLFDKIKSVPGMVARNSRRGSSHRRPATSPTVPTTSADSYTSPSSTVGENVIILVTTDADAYHAVPISRAKDPVFIRERIYTKLQISDEDQPYYSIYRTKIGAYALGDALSDEQLFDICRAQGDSSGSVIFFACHSSARMQDNSVHASSPVTRSCPPPVPPPVLNPGPLSPPRRCKPSGRSRFDSASSTSEPARADVAAGYEPSVSDDMEDQDVSLNRRAARLPMRQPSSRLKAAAGAPSSPGAGVKAHYGYPSGHTPTSTNQSVRPLSPSETYTGRTRPVDPLRIDKSGGPTSSVPPNGWSPGASRYATQQDPYISSNYSSSHLRNLSDAASDRERALRESESRIELAGKYWKPQRDGRDRYTPRQSGENESPEPWVVVPRDTPSTAQGQHKVRSQPSQELSRSPPLSRGGFDRDRAERKLPNERSVGRLTIPTAPRNPPPAPPSGRTPQPQRIPASWNASFNPAPKGESPWTPRLATAKSMSDLKNPIPSSLTPGGRRGNHLPVSGQPGEQRTVKMQMSSTNLRGPYEPSRTGAFSPPPRSRPLPSLSVPHTSELNQNSRAPTSFSSNYPGLLSPNREPFPRPSSALGDVSSPEAQTNGRTGPSPADIVHESDVLRARYADTVQPPLPPKPHLDPPNERPSDVYAGLADPVAPYQTSPPPRSPVSPLGPRPEKPHFDTPSPSLATPVGTTPHQDSPEESSESTLKGGEHDWFRHYLQQPHSDSSTLIPPLSVKSSPFQPHTTASSNDSGVDFGNNGSASTFMSHSSRVSIPEEGSDSGEDTGTGLWARPPLTVQTGFPPPPPPPPPIPPPPPPQMTSENSGRGRRVSVFVNNDQDTWAVRPPPEDVYERLEEFFPGHDLDKPVIDASTGGTSPTTTEHPIPLPPEPTEKRWKHKKSIRVVAAEHKKKIDRTSRMDPSSLASDVRRHRSTKLWDKQTEEVTAEKLRSSVPESPSPSAPPKPIFKWVRGEIIGKGTYGKVYLALNATTGEMIAVKQVEIPRTASDKNDDRQLTLVQALKQESETLKDLDHPNIVQYLGFEETPTHLSIFLEYVPGGSIGGCLKKHGKFDENVTKSFTWQILNGLEYLHSKGILHRDLKADNILVEATGVCKISDFGISKRTDDVNANGQFTAMQGTVFWMAPEMINSKENGYNSKIDIWSVGCIVLEMWAGERPWSTEEMVAVMFKLYGKAAPPVPQNVHLSALADDFRRKCFAINPDDRPTAAELRRHKYLILPPDWVFNGFK